MSLLKTLRRLDVKSLGKLVLLSVKNPFFILPTLKATKTSMRLASDHFEKRHHKNGPSNAFRHALWNYLIAKGCKRWSKKDQQVLKWTKAITDLHEEAFFGTEIATAMDLHNNEVGRHMFRLHPDEKEEKVVDILLEMTKTSVFVKSESDLESHKNQLVHIEHEA